MTGLCRLISVLKDEKPYVITNLSFIIHNSSFPTNPSFQKSVYCSIDCNFFNGHNINAFFLKVLIRYLFDDRMIFVWRMHKINLGMVSF